jgi:hypothetical protein
MIPERVDTLLCVFHEKNRGAPIKYLDSILIKQVFAETHGKITSSHGSPGSNYFAKGYLKGDIIHDFKELWEVIVDGERFMIFTTDYSIYCCSNSGEYENIFTLETEMSTVTNQIIIPSPILKLMYEFQGDNNFSGRIYILKGSKYMSMMLKAKENLAFARKYEGCVMIFTTTGSIYVHTR